MKINVDKIGEGGLSLNQPIEKALLQKAFGPDALFKPAGDGHLVLRLDRVENMIHARGKAALPLEAACVRCLDPVLLNVHSFGVIREYSWGNAVPLYVSTLGLAENGATAAIFADYGEMGRAAGRAARQALAGQPGASQVFPERILTVVNMTAASHVRVNLTKAVLDKADKVLP